MPYFETADFRDLMPDMGDESRYPDQLVETCRDAVEALIESVTGASYNPRAVTETLSGTGSFAILLSRPDVVSVTSASVGGTALAGADLTGLTFAAGVLKRPVGSVWDFGYDNVVVTYQAGAAAPPADLKLAAMEATRDRVMQLQERSGKVSDRATAITNEFGNYSLSTADKDHPTGLPQADAVIMRYARKRRVFGFA